MANATGSHLVAAAQVRVKRWGKSPPQWWRHHWHGKRRPVQGQIGRQVRSRKRLHNGWPGRGLRVGRLRLGATRVPEKWSLMQGCDALAGQNPAYRLPRSRFFFSRLALSPRDRWQQIDGGRGFLAPWLLTLVGRDVRISQSFPLIFQKFLRRQTGHSAQPICGDVFRKK